MYEDEETTNTSLLVALQLQKRPEILSKSHLPHNKVKKDNALKAAVIDLERQIEKPYNSSQLLKKINNMKTRLKGKVVKNKTGKRKIILNKWEKILHKLIDDPAISKIPEATCIDSTRQENNDDESVSSSNHSSLSPRSDCVTKDAPQKVFISSGRLKMIHQTNETEETSKMTTEELQRLLLIEQLHTTRVQRQYYEQRINEANIYQPNEGGDDGNGALIYGLSETKQEIEW